MMEPTWEDKEFGVQLYLADCMDVLPTLGEVDCVVTDPPYLVRAGAGGGAFGNLAHLVKTGGFTDGGCDHSFLQNFRNWFCFCSLKQLPCLISIAEKFDRWNLITWAKPNPVPTCHNKYLPDVEYIVHGFSKGNLYGEFDDKHSFFHAPSGKKETDHPNEKPLSLMKKLVTLATKQEQIVLDPFMGSGTTGVAAVQLGRQFIGIEREPKYFEIAVRRISEAIIKKQGGILCATHKPVQFNLLGVQGA